MKKHSSGVLVTVFSALAYGLYPPAVEIAYQEGANSIFIITFTTAFRAFSLILFSLCAGHKIIPSRNELWPYISGGFFQALSIFGIILSIAYIPGPITITIVFTHTIFLLLFLIIKGEERLSFSSFFSTLFALIGISLLVNFWGTASGVIDIKGVVLAFIASFATASRLYVFGRQVKELDPALVGARIFSVATIICFLSVFFFSPLMPGTTLGWFGVLLSALSLSLGTLLMFYGLRDLGAFRYSLIVKCEPVFTSLFSVLVLGHFLELSQYLGVLFIIYGIINFQIKTKQKN
ncbi:MAG TPA: DMT family transporter [Oligoflexia bacterium]|nr:DMT family transporter [Oligoflexia bacterium]HMP47137.1 DMT family transporter [Oligoflexia bacterium]